jgi:hypothetical protein
VQNQSQGFSPQPLAPRRPERKARKPGKSVLLRGIQSILDYLVTRTELERYHAEHGCLPPRSWPYSVPTGRRRYDKIPRSIYCINSKDGVYSGYRKSYCNKTHLLVYEHQVGRRGQAHRLVPAFLPLLSLP